MTKTVTLLGVSIRMMARVLAQMIEGLCILKNSAGSLIQSQEFIQLSLNQSLGNMMCPKSIPEFLPRYNMSDRAGVPDLSVSGDKFDLAEDDPHDPTTTSEPEVPMQSLNQLPVVTDLVDARSA